MTILWKLSQSLTRNKLPYGIARLSPKARTTPMVVRRMQTDDPVIKPTINVKVENKARFADKVSDDWILVYKSRITTHMTVFYHIAYMFVIAGIVGIIHLKYGQEVSFPTTAVIMSIGYHSENELLLTYGGLIVMNAFLFMCCRIHAARIWYNPTVNKYLLVVVNGTFKSMKKIEFDAENIVQKYKNARTSVGRAPHRVNGKTYHIVETNFRTPSVYHKLVGDTYR